MLTISPAQMNAIGDAIAEQRVVALVAHARAELAPALVQCDDASVAKAIRTALRRAQRLGWTTQGPARHYVECALLFGCDVAQDGFHPWFARGLAAASTSAHHATHADAADHVHAALTQAWPTLFGGDGQRWVRALDRLQRFDALRAFPDSASLPQRVSEALNLLYPAKWQGGEALAQRALVHAAVERAAHGIAPAVSGLIACLQLYFGRGVLVDSLFAWLREALADPDAAALQTQVRAYAQARALAHTGEVG